MVGRRHKGGGTTNSRGPPGIRGWRAQKGREGSLVGCSEGRQPAAGWAAKPGASGGGGGRGVTARGGGDGGRATVETSCRCGTSSVGRRVDGAAAGANSGQGEAAPWGSGWQAATASWS